METEGTEILENYQVVSDGISADVKILRIPAKFTMSYRITTPVIDQSMGAVHFSKGTKKENKGYGYSPIDFITDSLLLCEAERILRCGEIPPGLLQEKSIESILLHGNTS